MLLNLEKKVESKNIEVRADFTRELQKLAAQPHDPIDPEKLKENFDLQIKNLETNFTNQFLKRIEITENGIDNVSDRLEKFMNAVTLDAEKQAKLEAALKDHIDLINHLTEKQ